jgi:hypothetical protein
MRAFIPFYFKNFRATKLVTWCWYKLSTALNVLN